MSALTASITEYGTIWMNANNQITHTPRKKKKIK